ncbi:MAG: hypothetical protein Q9165_003404 [Trypethelium subeluteriae]
MKFNLFGRGLPLQLAITVCCEMAFILFGYDQGVFSGIVGNEAFLNTVNHPSPGKLGIILEKLSVVAEQCGSQWFGLLSEPRYNQAHTVKRRFSSVDSLQELGPESTRVYDKHPDNHQILKEQDDILKAIKLEGSVGTSGWTRLFKEDDIQTRKRIALAYGMQFMNQMGGINLVVYFIPTVLQDNVGLTRNLSLLLGGVINIMFIIGSFVPAFLVDRIGRRRPMMWGSFGLGISMMLISILLSFQGTSVQKPTSSASVAFFFTYMLIFGASVNCIPCLHARAKGTAIGISSNWTWNFFVVMITPTLIANLKWKGYLIFMCLNFAFIPLVYFCYPETANLTLEEIDHLYTEPGRQARHIARDIRKERKMGLRHTPQQLEASRENELAEEKGSSGSMEHVEASGTELKE